MVKDYFQDIVPPSDEPHQERTPFLRSPAPDISDGDEMQGVPIRVGEANAPARGIRSISAPSRPRPADGGARARVGVDMREASLATDDGVPHPPRRYSRLWIWAAAAVSLLILTTLLLVLTMRSTVITVTPKSQIIALTETIPFTAYPKERAAPGTLPYTVKISELEDSEVVPAQGTTHVENKASGSITVLNNYSAAGVRLVKNTRFETPEGLIFRVPADIVIPGKSTRGPGEIKVTVIADKAGEKYNIGPVTRFTLPGLKSGDMYAQVYARSSESMAGGLVGEVPGTAPGALNAAIAAVRDRLATKARQTVLAEATSEMVILPDLMQITYQSQANTTEAGGGVRIHEKARALIPVFPADVFAAIVARSAAADSDNAPISLIAGSDLAAHVKVGSTSVLGQDPINFSLSGEVQLIWKVDAAALAKALAGRDNGAFQTIVNGFAGIQEAHARIEPFWKRTFPAQASDIKVNIVAPERAR